jgi:hypothetical protein
MPPEFGHMPARRHGLYYGNHLLIGDGVHRFRLHFFALAPALCLATQFPLDTTDFDKIPFDAQHSFLPSDDLPR